MSLTNWLSIHLTQQEMDSLPSDPLLYCLKAV